MTAVLAERVNADWMSLSAFSAHGGLNGSLPLRGAKTAPATYYAGRSMVLIQVDGGKWAAMAVAGPVSSSCSWWCGVASNWVWK